MANNTATTRKFYKNLFLNKGYNKAGQEIVTGSVKLFLRKAYGKNTCAEIRDVTINGGQTRKVCALSSSIRVEDYTAKQLKYFFDVDIATGTYVDININVWGKAAESLGKFNISEGDLYFFIASSVSMNTFDRKNGGIGYQMVVNALDFDPVKTAGKNGNGQPATQSAPATSNFTAPQNAFNGENDFDSYTDFDDEDDLPF